MLEAGLGGDDRLRIGRIRRLNTWRSLGKGPVFYKLGKLIRYRLSEVESWINSNRRGPDESQGTQREMALPVLRRSGLRHEGNPSPDRSDDGPP
jgi:hypothetical protein